LQIYVRDVDLLVPEILHKFFKPPEFVPEPADFVLKTITLILKLAYSILEPSELSLKACSGLPRTLLVCIAFNYSILHLNSKLSL
jgi:hypothetical protein